MANLTFEPSAYFNRIGGHPAALRVAPGDTVTTTTVDAHGVDRSGAPITDPPNPMTGPFLVEGAAPGDTLIVDLLSIEPNRATCWSRATVSGVVLPADADRPSTLSDGKTEILEWAIDRSGGTATASPRWNGPGPRIALPLAPMLGCLGTAPPIGQSISTATSGTYGGNMDWKGVHAGMTMLFPVYINGAMFHLGDCHASQGDGEICGTGLEVSADVRFRVGLRKDIHVDLPCAIDERAFYTIGNARPLEDALRLATAGMARILCLPPFELTPDYVQIMLGQCVRYEVANMFDPAYSVVCSVELSRLGDPASILDRFGRKAPA